MATAALEVLSPTLPPDDAAPARTQIEHYLVSERKAMLGLALHLTHNQAEADELVQAASLHCLLRAHLLRHQDNLPGWVGRIISRLFLDQWRRNLRALRRFDQQTWALAEALPAAEPTEAQDECPWEWVTVGDVRVAARQLTARQRVVFELFTFSGLSYEEIAMRLEIPMRTVGTRLLRARARLRVLLAANVQAGGRVTPLVKLPALDDGDVPCPRRQWAVG